MKTESHCGVHNDDNNNNQEEGASAVYSGESGLSMKERSTDETLTGNKNEHAGKVAISKAKGKHRKQKKVSKGKKGSQTTTKAKKRRR